MNKLRALPRIVLAALIIAGISAPLCEAADRDRSQTRIIHLGHRVKGNRTSLIFDAVGPRPKRIGPASDAGISVFFSNMAASLPDRSFNGKTAVKEVRFRRGSNFFEVLFRSKGTTVTSNVRTGRLGGYVLTLFLTSPGAKPASSNEPETTDFIKKAPAEAQPIQVENVKTSELFGSTGVPARMKDALADKLRSEKADEPQKAREGTAPFVEPDKNGLALYERANKKFEACSRDLIFCASDIVDAYHEALKAGPGASQAPLAIYRSGLAYYIMGQYRSADKYFRAVTSHWPDNPVACRCWIGIGDIFIKDEAYIQAMEAYRWALRLATAREDAASAKYALGKTYLTLGANREALDMLLGSLAREPDFYVKNPGVFRFIGEADFVLGDLANAKQMLLRYVNCQESDTDQGMILAKIAEIFLKQDQTAAAKKIYAYVQKYYANSEGDLICRMRAAELMEKVDIHKAILMYDDLRDRDLSPTLRSVVLLKLAELELKKSDLEHGLALLDLALQINAKGTPPPGIAPLREKILCGLMRQVYFDHNFEKETYLAEKYRVVLDSINSPETLEEIAESYAAQKSYLKALQTYDRLFEQQRGVNLDGLLLRCAAHALRLRDYDRASHYAQSAQSGALKLKKSEILGQVFYRNEQYADAVDCFEKVAQQRNQFYLDDPDSNEAYGYSLYRVKKYAEAVPVLKRALHRQTMDKDGQKSLLVTISDCLKEQKQYGAAAETMETATRIAGANEKNELLFRLSKLYIADGKTDQAVQVLNRIMASSDAFWNSVAQQELNTINIAAGNAGNKQ